MLVARCSPEVTWRKLSLSSRKEERNWNCKNVQFVTSNNKTRYITVTWVNSECLVWSQKKCEKSRLSIESTVDSIPPMETTSFPYRANVREKKNNHVPLEGARQVGREKSLIVNDLINASYLINAPLRCQVCIKRPFLINAPCENCPKILGNGKIEQKSINLLIFHCLINIGLCIMSCSWFQVQSKGSALTFLILVHTR